MILMVGTFPPPLHGMSAIHQAVYDLLTAEGVDVARLNTAPTSLRQDLLSRFSRWGGVLRAWGRLLGARQGKDRLYIALSGRWGQLYDVVTLVIARSRGLPCFLHHHNFAYLDRRSRLTALLVRIAGPAATHVVLCGEMGRILRALYGVRKTIVLSNILFSSSEPVGRTDPQARTIGLLSNLTREKGTETIIELASAIQSRGLPLQVVLAGPCLDPALLQKLEGAVAAGALAWRGPAYGEEKAAFWRDIDVFVFPTQSEAEPNVIWESLVAGVPVITYPRGCIQEQVGEAGVMIDPGENFVSRALEVLEQWGSCPEEYRRFVRSTGVQYQEMQARAAQQWQELLRAVAD